MNHRKRILALATPLTLLLLAAPARAGDFIDTRISYTLGDDNFFKNAGEQVPDSPSIGIGDRPGYELPFDNLDLRTTGRENELHLALYKKVEGIFPGLTTEALAAVRLSLGASIGFGDDSSYIRLAYALDRARTGKHQLEVVLFPLSSDRFRIGTLWDLTWAGGDMFPRGEGISPAFKLGGTHGKFYWWGGMKMVLAEKAPTYSTDESGTVHETTDKEMLYSALGGAGVEPTEGLKLDLSGGHVQNAWNRNKTPGVEGSLVTSSGFSARIGYGKGLKVGLSADLQLVRTDIEYLEALSRKPKYDPGGGVSWRVSLEGTAFAQILEDPDVFGGTKAQWAPAAALDARMQYRYLRLNFTTIYRSLGFAVANLPGMPAYQAFSGDALVQPQLVFALAADYNFPRVALTPGAQVGLEMPAAVKTELYARDTGSTGPPTLVGTHTLLVRYTGDLVVLPEGQERLPAYYARATLRWDPSEIITLIAFVQLVYDQNTTILKLNPDLTKSRVFDEPVRLGAGFVAQARF
jgi:hypothetical protein